MDLLITLIGNAAVDPIFRKRFLAEPLETADAYGFRLTKGEVDLLQQVFTKSQRSELERSFEALEKVLYLNVGGGCKKPPCAWTTYPPPQFRKDYIPDEKKKAA